MEKQNFCEQCLHYRACLLNSEYVPSRCSCYEDKAGYRKASDVAMEIFEEIEKIVIVGEYISADDFYKDHPLIAELKKKYTEGGE